MVTSAQWWAGCLSAHVCETDGIAGIYVEEGESCNGAAGVWDVRKRA